MWIDTQTIIGITQINENLNRVIDIINKHGYAIIMKNNYPVYVVYDINNISKELLESIPRITFRDASRNLSKLIYIIYDSGNVIVTKNKKPIAVFFDFNILDKVNVISPSKGE
ncbi:MAG: hypothetical protein IKW90_17375 [Lachnospiraceae bacterium]|nr:hypothetical protein [Lachnospiraceae bacterium]